MKKIIVSSVIISLIICSCGSGDVHREQIQSSKSYDMPKILVWNTALTLMAKNFFVVKTISNELFMVQYDYRDITVDDMYNYTTTEGGDYLAARRSVFIELKGDSAKSSITINTDYEGLWREMNILGAIETGYQKLYSNGRLEKELFAELDKQLLLAR